MVSKLDILRNVSIVEVAESCSIDLERVSSGNFDYRCKCPSKDHKHGSERTSSCYINSADNNFYCFGCNAGYNVIDFYMLSNDISFSEAMSSLRTMVDESDISSDRVVAKRGNFSILMEISSFIRKYNDMFIYDSKWMNSFSKKIDLYIEKLALNAN
tara:strand:- start:22 stop:492 length:471 start_codon:yes stop_codon:yes gene_type:complete